MKTWVFYDEATGEIDTLVDFAGTPQDRPGLAKALAEDYRPHPDEAFVDVATKKVKKYTAAQKKAKKERPLGTKWDNKTKKVVDDRNAEQKAIDEEREVRQKRRREYPRLEEFADAFYWQSKGDPAPMAAYLAKVEAIKKKHPKKGEVIV